MKENNSKEINLINLFSLIFVWLKKIIVLIVNFSGYLIKLAYRKIWIVGTFVIVSIGISLYLTRPEAKIYKAEGTALLFGCDAHFIIEYARQLENLSESNSQLSYSNILNLPKDVSKNIVQISAYYVVDFNSDKTPDKVDFSRNHSLEDTINVIMNDRVYIQLKTKDTKQVKVVENAILNYFNSNSTLKDQYIISRNQSLNEIELANTETKRLDSLANVSYFRNFNEQVKFTDNKLIIGEQQKQLFYEDLYNLADRRTGAEYALARYKKPVQIPTGLIISLRPVNSTTKYLTYSILISLAISLLLAVFIENFKKISNYLKD